MVPKCWWLGLAVVLISANLLQADDWPQWNGPRRDGTWTEKGITCTLPETLKPIWRTPIQVGYSGPAVANDRVFVMDYVRRNGVLENDPAKVIKLSGFERILCLDAKTGKELWQHKYESIYELSYAGGPRCTPTVDGDRVYTLGAMGNLTCLDAVSGKVLWEKDFRRDFTAPLPTWGFCGHPLVYKDLLICLVGGEGSLAVAFDKTTGKEVWRQLSHEKQGYCPPTIIRHGGVDQLFIWHPHSVNCLEPGTGKKHWSYELKPDYNMSIAAPVIEEDTLFVGGMGWQSAALTLSLNAGKPAMVELWRGKKDTSLYPSISTPIIYKGTIYGCDAMSGKFRAVELNSGKRLWETMEATAGNVERASHATAFAVCNGEHGYLFAETGELIVVELNPLKYTQVSRTKLIEPTSDSQGRKVVWSPPAFANKCIYVRNDTEIACFSLAK